MSIFEKSMFPTSLLINPLQPQASLAKETLKNMLRIHISNVWTDKR